MELAQDHIQWQHLVTVVLKLRVKFNGVSFLQEVRCISWNLQFVIFRSTFICFWGRKRCVIFCCEFSVSSYRTRDVGWRQRTV